MEKDGDRQVNKELESPGEGVKDRKKTLYAINFQLKNQVKVAHSIFVLYISLRYFGFRSISENKTQRKGVPKI